MWCGERMSLVKRWVRLNASSAFTRNHQPRDCWPNVHYQGLGHSWVPIHCFNKMSFFRKDYSQHPQPVVVKSDRREGDDSITHDVTGHGSSALSSGSRFEGGASASSSLPSGPTTEVKTARKNEDQPQERQDLQQGDDQSTHTNTHDSSTIPQQQDTTKLADGIMSLLGPIVQEMDFNIVSVRKSQTELEKDIERLMAGMYQRGLWSRHILFIFFGDG